MCGRGQVGEDIGRDGKVLEFLIESKGRWTPAATPKEGGERMANRKCVKDTRISLSGSFISFFLSVCFLATKLQIFSSGNFKFSSERVKLKCSLDLCKYLHCIDRHNLRFTVQVFCPCLPFPLHPYQHLWR